VRKGKPWTATVTGTIHQGRERLARCDHRQRTSACAFYNLVFPHAGPAGTILEAISTTVILRQVFPLVQLTPSCVYRACWGRFSSLLGDRALSTRKPGHERGCNLASVVERHCAKSCELRLSLANRVFRPVRDICRTCSVRIPVRYRSPKAEPNRPNRHGESANAGLCDAHCSSARNYRPNFSEIILLGWGVLGRLIRQRIQQGRLSNPRPID